MSQGNMSGGEYVQKEMSGSGGLGLFGLYFIETVSSDEISGVQIENQKGTRWSACT